MPDNVTTQDALLATLPTATPIAAAEVTFSGDTVLVGLGVLAKVAGAEGSRTATMVDPATEALQTAGNASLSSIDTKLTNPLPVSGPLTDAQLRATPVPVSGTVATGGLTDAELRATPVPVSGTVAVSAIAGALPAGNNNIGDVDIASSVLPTGAATLAEQQTQTTSLAILDDWDESDRAKVNPIVGQAGIAAGTGVDGVTVPRVTLATNVGLPAGTNNIGDVDVLTLPAKKQFFGTAQTVISTAVDVAAGNFSVTTTTYDNTNDSSYPQARLALAVGSFPDWAAAPVAGTTIDLYGIALDVDGTSDETDAPSGTAPGGGHYFGSWTMAAADALQRRAIVIDVTGYQKIDFYFWNRTAQNMNNDGGTSAIVKITPLTGN